MITAPTPIIDLEKIDRNIKRMHRLCEKWQMDFRPHFKTHQSAALAGMFKKKGIHKCTVSSVSMALYFAANGWQDITIAIPVNILEIEGLKVLAHSVNLNLIVDHQDSCTFLKENLKQKVSVFIEIDTGYGRSGIYYKNTDVIHEVLQIIEGSPLLEFLGFLSHTGNNYATENPEEGARTFEEARIRMLQLQKKYQKRYPQLMISLGNTPSSAFAKSFEGVQEWRPGNFIFYDLMQYQLGACKIDDIAMAIRCPVIGIYPQRGEFVIYGGGVHLSKESLLFQGQQLYGWIRNPLNTNDVSGFPVIGLSQEHGTVSASREYLKALNIGDVVDIIPVHSCMSADLYNSYTTNTGEIIMKYRTNS